MSWAETLSLGALGIMLVHRAVAMFAIRSWKASAPESRPGSVPIAWLRPLKRGVRDLDGKIARFLSSIGAEDQAIFGVDPGSEEERICLERARGDERVSVVVCEKSGGGNPKIAKLIQMDPQVSREYCALVDAEAEIGPDFVGALRAELEASLGSVVTVPYRFVGMRSALEYLDILPSVQTLLPGMMLVRAFGRVRFTLGACTGFPQADLEAIGGWSVLKDRLAEDHQLGQLLTASRRTIRISRQVLELESDELTYRDYLRHQHRIAVTYRAAEPWGALGMIFPRGFTLTTLCFLFAPGVITAAGWGGGLLVHLIALVSFARSAGYRLGGWVFLGPVSELVESVCWLAAWFTHRTYWAGKWHRISWRGILRDSE